MGGVERGEMKSSKLECTQTGSRGELHVLAVIRASRQLTLGLGIVPGHSYFFDPGVDEGVSEGC